MEKNIGSIKLHKLWWRRGIQTYEHTSSFLGFCGQFQHYILNLPGFTASNYYPHNEHLLYGFSNVLLNICNTEKYQPTQKGEKNRIRKSHTIPNPIRIASDCSRLKVMVKSLVTPVCMYFWKSLLLNTQTNKLIADCWDMVQVCDCKTYR